MDHMKSVTMVSHAVELFCQICTLMIDRYITLFIHGKIPQLNLGVKDT